MSAHGFGLGECVGLWIGSHAGLIFCFCIRRQNSLCLLLHLFLGRDGNNLWLGGPILEVLPGRRLTGLAAVAVMGSTWDRPFRAWVLEQAICYRRGA